MAKEKDMFWINYWNNHRERALSNKWYSIQRMDLLIISISAGGVYVVMELIKFVYEEGDKISVDAIWLKVCGFLFVISIITNFISQVFSFNANKFEAKYAYTKIKEERGEDYDVEKRANADCWVKLCNKGVSITNAISIGFMLLGLILISVVVSTVI